MVRPVGSSPLARGLRPTLSPLDLGGRIIPARAGFTGGLGGGDRLTADHPRSRGVYVRNWRPNRVSLGSSPLARGLHPSPRSPAPGRGIIPARAGFTRHAPGLALRCADHPRSRGVYDSSEAWAASSWGSSPLARGLRMEGPHRRHQQGIIPARAGFTPLPRGSNMCAKDHPRSRGVYIGTMVTQPVQAGSSPLARGLRSLGVSRSLAQRIIPARAGFTVGARGHPPGRADHPRSRGVYCAHLAKAAETRGSSPLARGLHPLLAGGRPVDGIIPARAGFTAGPTAPARVLRDHPRSRGVYASTAPASRASSGSSPLARGLLRADGGLGGPVGIIPARAGFTTPPMPWCWAPADHPRSRGVYAWPSAREGRGSGSSPLARGLLDAAARAGTPMGIIPARAGFTGHGRRQPRLRQDHPRSRGVYDGSVCIEAFQRGSSPLARGLRGPRRHRPQGPRIIPARAGFTASTGRPTTTAPDHPRSRGVYACAHSPATRAMGSSPLARGLPSRRNPSRRARTDHPRSRGVYPVGGGAFPLPRGDHPRSRGVYARASQAQPGSGGSSPLARGLLGDDCDGGHCGRIIPARAGFTRRDGPGVGGLRDHPRSRGVYGARRVARFVLLGSSPLARGLRDARPR